MAFNLADWTVDYALKTVTNNDSGIGNNLPSALGDYSKVGEVLEFFQWLALTFANTTQMDDEYAFLSDTPTVYKWVNGWAFGHADDYKYLRGASITSSDANDFWSNAYTIGSQTDGTLIYLMQNDVEVTPWWIASDGTDAGNIDILVHVKTGGVWIQSDNTAGVATDGGIWLYAREFGDLYDHGFADISGGRSPIGINTSLDGNNTSGEEYVSVTSSTGFTVGQFVKDETTGAIGKIAKVVANDIYLNAVRGGVMTATNTLAEYSERECVNASGTSQIINLVTAVVSAYSDITDTFGAISRDLNNGAGLQSYDMEFNCAGRSMGELYEWTKFLTRYGSKAATYTVNLDDGQEYRSAGEGTYSDVKVAPFGTLAGTTFYGARGVWVTNYSIADFVLIDATNTPQSPPDYQKAIASHTDLDGSESALGGCKVFVAEITGSGGTIIKNQYQYLSAGSNVTTLVVDSAIDINKTPQTGNVRIGDNKYPYTSFSGTAFTVTVDPTGEANLADAYVPLLDVAPATVDTEQSDNIIYSGIPFWCRTETRRYGTKPYTADVQFGANGISFSPILATDPQAN